MKSDSIIESYKLRFAQICSLPTSTEDERILFLRQYLSLLNEFLFEYRPSNEIETLNTPDELHPGWRRLTPFLSVWDDYAESTLGITFDEIQIKKLAQVFVDVFSKNQSYREQPALLVPDQPHASLGGLTPKEFALIRLMHASQDFAIRLPPIDERLVAKIHDQMGAVPDEKTLTDATKASQLLSVFGGADNNVDERLRYICNISTFLQSQGIAAYDLANKFEFDAKFIFKALTIFPGIKSKKANMIMRDFYDMGIWQIRSNLQEINIIADNRVMRVALRTGIIRPKMGKLLNSLLDQFDFQYVLCVAATEEAFKRVWMATKQFNNNEYAVSYPGRLDAFVFKLADGRSGCCKKTARACRNNKMPPAVRSWLQDSLHFETEFACPFQSVCPDDTRHLISPFAIQNNTWVGEIFTGAGGGGGLSGI